ncbi:MAG: BamA/TamA family outer membrane protein [Calditrichia bacterium]
MTVSKLKSTGDTIFKLPVFLLFLTIFTLPLQADRLKVKKIEIKGNKAFSSAELRSLLKSEKGEPFNSKFLRLDRTILQNFYDRQGFLNVWVENNVERDGDDITIIYDISEGNRFLLDTLMVSGAQMLSPQQVKNRIDIKAGEVFRQQAVESGLNTLEQYYLNHGKPYVILDEERNVTDSLISVQINIQENETVIIREVGYSGLNKVKQFVVDRELEIKKGDLYSREKIERSQRNIYSTGLFEFVGIELQPLDTSRSRVRLNIKLVEKDSRWIGLRFGVGYEQEVAFGGTFDFTFEIGQRNLLGTARTISATVIPSFSYDFANNKIRNPKNQYAVTFVEPWLGFTRTPGVFQTSYLQARPLNSADYNYFTSSFQVRHEFNKVWQTTGTIAFNRVKVLDQDSLSTSFFNQTRGQDFIYSLQTSLARDKRDSYLNPQDGSVMEGTLRFAYANSRDQASGETSVNRYFKLMGKWNRYQNMPFFKSWVFATRIRSGNIFELGQRSRIPVLERFYLGGSSTVRGYPEQLLGPVAVDESGRVQAIGGKFMLLANAEIRLPLVWLLWAEVFTDAGNVWLQLENFRPIDIKSTSGAGLALVTPLGPIRFDYGIKHRPEKGESFGEFHMSISFAF